MLGIVTEVTAPASSIHPGWKGDGGQER